MDIKRNSTALFIVFTSAVIILFSVFHKIILAPQKWMFAHLSGDGLKNYFTVMYYTKYDEGLLFSGMNYPYGEYIHYIDCHPIMSIFLRFINKNVISIDHLMPGLISYWLLFLIPIGAMVIYLLLREFNISRGFAVICALIITFLSPQIDRISDHHALSYVFLFPLAWFLFIKAYKQPNRVHMYGVCLSLLMLFSAWIHAYYVPIIGFFLLALYAVILLTNQPQKKNFSLLVYPLIGILISYLSLSLFDPFVGRPLYPWGIGVYTTTWEGTLFPSKGYLHSLVNKVYSIRETPWEGQSYIGILGIFVLLLMLGRLVVRWIHSKKARISSNTVLNLSLLAGFLLFLLATGIFHKYIFRGHEDLFKQLYQFRSLGRFAWAFYYPMAIGIAYFIYVGYRFISMRLSRTWSLVFVISCSIIWSIDAYIQVSHERDTGVHKNSMIDKRSLLIENLIEKAGHSINDFQASLPIPYTNIGAKLLTKYDGSWVYGHAMRLAYQSRLPIMGLFTARPSSEHSVQLRQLFSSSFIEKKILDHMDDRPILIIHKGEINTDYEKDLLNKAELITQNEHFDLYKIYPRDLKCHYDKLSNTGLTADTLISLAVKDLPKIIPSQAEHNYESFDNWDYPEGFVRRGRLIKSTPNHSSSISLNIAPFTKTKIYTVTFWLRLDNTVKKTPEVKLHERNSSGVNIKTHHIWWRFEPDVYDGWLRVKREIQFHKNSSLLTLEVYKNDLVVDEILIQELKSDFIYQRGEDLLINNYIIESTPKTDDFYK